jgi:hypothetical protein
MPVTLLIPNPRGNMQMGTGGLGGANSSQAGLGCIAVLGPTVAPPTAISLYSIAKIIFSMALLSVASKS